MPDSGKVIIRQLALIITSNRLTYLQFNQYCKLARKKVGLVTSKKPKQLPQLLTDIQLARFFGTMEKGLEEGTTTLRDILLLKMLLFTGLRVSELINIPISYVDIGECKIYIKRGKGDKDRYVLFPESMKLVIQAYLQTCPNNQYLFESNRCTKLSARRVQQIVKIYQLEADIDTNMHPHLFRHQLLTYLTKSGLTDAQIQLISGHASKQSLEVYQHMGLSSVKGDYQEAMKGMGV